MKIKRRKKNNTHVSYKELKKELIQYRKDLQAFEIEVENNEASNLKNKKEAESTLEEIMIIEKKIERDLSEIHKKKEMMAQVRELKEKIKHNIDVISDSDKDIKETKKQIDVNYVQNKNLRKVLRKEKIKTISIFTSLITALLIVSASLIYLGLNLFAYLLIGQIVVIMINKWLINRKKLLNIGLILILFFIIFTYVIGYETSASQSKYITFEKNDEDYVVLTVYNDQFLYAPFDDSTKEIKSEFNFVNISESPDLNFSEIGKITIE